VACTTCASAPDEHFPDCSEHFVVLDAVFDTKVSESMHEFVTLSGSSPYFQPVVRTPVVLAHLYKE